MAYRTVVGRAESPLFPPVYPDEAHAREELLHLVHRDPHEWGLQRSRWRLVDLLKVLSPDWTLTSQPGLHRLLKRMGIHWKRGRSFIHSPDKHYQEKLARIAALKTRAEESQGTQVLLYQDECSIERQPSVGYNWEEAGTDAPHAQRKPRYNTVTRIMATLDPQTGQVVFSLIGKVTTSALVSFYRKVVAAYPQAERIWIVQDNWPVHLHPNLLAALEPQEKIYPVAFSPSWMNKIAPSPLRHHRHARTLLPVQIVQLPTYASWCNPIEKLWRWLKQDLIHLHRNADDLEELRLLIRSFLARFEHGSQSLLRYVGLSPK